jgi:hypothetical protein
MLDSAAMYNGLLRRGTANATMVIPPENKPAAPEPAIALPTMRTFELGATAQTIEPTTQWLGFGVLESKTGSITFKNSQSDYECILDIKISVYLAKAWLQ